MWYLMSTFIICKKFLYIHFDEPSLIVIPVILCLLSICIVRVLRSLYNGLEWSFHADF